MGLKKMSYESRSKWISLLFIKFYMFVGLCREQWPRSMRRVIIFYHSNTGIAGSNRAPYLSVFLCTLPCDETICTHAVQAHCVSYRNNRELVFLVWGHIVHGCLCKLSNIWPFQQIAHTYYPFMGTEVFAGWHLRIDK
jgi:hypothetical protein